jgi:hypothetical protein
MLSTKVRKRGFRIPQQPRGAMFEELGRITDWFSSFFTAIAGLKETLSKP